MSTKRVRFTAEETQEGRLVDIQEGERLDSREGAKSMGKNVHCRDIRLLCGPPKKTTNSWVKKSSECLSF